MFRSTIQLATPSAAVSLCQIYVLQLSQHAYYPTLILHYIHSIIEEGETLMFKEWITAGN
jgi:hypothetical protein